jgi:hypothetical protein
MIEATEREPSDRDALRALRTSRWSVGSTLTIKTVLGGLLSKDGRPQKRPLTSGSGVELIYRPSASVLEANSPRPAGYDAVADQAGEHGYLRRKVVCRRPKGCGAEYPLVPERIPVAWPTAVVAHDTELRLGGRR